MFMLIIFTLFSTNSLRLGTAARTYREPIVPPVTQFTIFPPPLSFQQIVGVWFKVELLFKDVGILRKLTSSPRYSAIVAPRAILVV